MSKQEFDPIAELNKENAWRFWKPFIQPTVFFILLSPVLILLIWLCVLFGEFIDWAFTNYWVQSAWFLVVGSLALIVRREIKRF